MGLRLMNEDKMVRIDYTKKDSFFFIDVTLENTSAKMRKCAKRFEDRSVNALEQGQGINNLSNMQKHLAALVEDESKCKNVIRFPQGSQDWNTVAVLNRQIATEKFITIFDVKRDGFFRRVTKKEMKTEAFNISGAGTQIMYIEGDELLI